MTRTSEKNVHAKFEPKTDVAAKFLIGFQKSRRARSGPGAAVIFGE